MEMIDKKLFITGSQEVALEIIDRKCWKCNNNIEVISNILFPSTPISTWKPCDRKYYASITLNTFTNLDQHKEIASHVEILRNSRKTLCKVGFRSSSMSISPYFANICPSCSKIQGDFPVKEDHFAAMRQEVETKKEMIKTIPITINIDGKLIDIASKCSSIDSSKYFVLSNYLLKINNPIIKRLKKLKNRIFYQKL